MVMCMASTLYKKYKYIVVHIITQDEINLNYLITI